MEPRIELQWSLTRDGDRLRVRHRVHNAGSRTVHVCEGLIVERGDGRYEPTDRLVVTNGERPGEVSFSLGQVAADMPVIWILPARFRALPPGASHEGEAVLPWPLEAWHTNGPVSPLARPLRSATLAVQYFEGEPEWRTLPGPRGETIQVGEAFRARVATADAQPLDE